MKKIVLLLICMFSLCAYAQETKNTESSPASEEDVVFVVAEVMPEFPGGQSALFRYLSENIEYPAVARENGIEGRAIVQFIVNKDGSLANVEVVRSSGDASLDEEAERVIQSMPKWKPGMRQGNPARVKYMVPVNFSLQGVKKTKTSHPQSSKPIAVHVGDTICPISFTTTQIKGYCCDTIFITEAPKKWKVNGKSAADYYVLTGECAKDIYNFTHYTNGGLVERGCFRISSSNSIQYLDTFYCYKDGRLTEVLLYPPMETEEEKINIALKNIPLKAKIYDKQEQLLREYIMQPVIYVNSSKDGKGDNKTANNKTIKGWKEFYKDGFYSMSTIGKENIPQTIFYTPQGRKASAKQPKLTTSKKTIEKQLVEYVTTLHTRTEMIVKLKINFHVDEAGNVVAARCGRMQGEFPSWCNQGQIILSNIEAEVNGKLKDMLFEFEPGTINKVPQHMMHSVEFSLRNNPKLVTQKPREQSASIPSEVHEGDTLWFARSGLNNVIYKDDTIRYSPRYKIVTHAATTSFYAITHETEDGIVEWHIHDLKGEKKAVLRHADHKVSAPYVGAKDYYRDNRLLCSEYYNKSDNSLRIIWYNSQEKIEKEYLLTEKDIVRQCNLYKEDGKLYQELFYYPDYVLDYGFEYDNNEEKHLIKPEKKDILWQVGDTVALKLLNPMYEAGNDAGKRYFMYRDEYMVDNKQDSMNVYGVVEAVANDTLWVAGYERSTGVKTCSLCYCIRQDGSFVHTGLQMFCDNKGLPMSGITYQHGIPVRSHWYKADGTEYLCFDLKLTDKKTLIPSQMTWLSGQTFKMPEIKNSSLFIKTLNKSLGLQDLDPYYGKAIALLIVGSDGTKHLLVKKASLSSKKETAAIQIAEKEIEDCLEKILASWDITPAKAGYDNVSMPMVLVLDFKKSSGFVSVQSPHQDAKY